MSGRTELPLHQSPSDPSPGQDQSRLIPPSPQLSFPLNYAHVVVQFLLLVALLPVDAIRYSLGSRRSRPRESWTVLESVLLNGARRYLAMMDKSGFKISARDVFAEPRRREISSHGQTVEFEWIEEHVDRELTSGTVIDDEDTNCDMRDKVGMYSLYRRRRPRDEADAHESNGLVGIFFHGGAFTHNSAHPSSTSSVMPRTLFEREERFDSMHSVEFRLLPEYPFPAQLQDAVTVYVALLRQRNVRPENIVLIGDSSGANIALSLASWIRDTVEEKPLHSNVASRDDGHHDKEKGRARWKLRVPGGLILFSPWVDPSHSFLDSTPDEYVQRSNSCDYIFESGPFRHHLVHSLLGRRETTREGGRVVPARDRRFVLSPYLSPGRVRVPVGTFANLVTRPQARESASDKNDLGGTATSARRGGGVFAAYGTGERGQAECERLISYLKRDLEVGGEGDEAVRFVETRDTPHDVLLMAFWRKEQREQVWNGALDFLKRLPAAR